MKCSLYAEKAQVTITIKGIDSFAISLYILAYSLYKFIFLLGYNKKETLFCLRVLLKYIWWGKFRFFPCPLVKPGTTDSPQSYISGHLDSFCHKIYLYPKERFYPFFEKKSCGQFLMLLISHLSHLDQWKAGWSSCC